MVRLRALLTFMGIVWAMTAQASMILIPMDETQSNHLKGYGIAFWALGKEVPVDWLLNWEGVSYCQTTWYRK